MLLEKLDRLRRTVREVIQQTDTRERDFTTRTNRLRAQFDQATATERDRWTNGSTEAENTAARKRERAQNYFAARKARITLKGGLSPREMEAAMHRVAIAAVH